MISSPERNMNGHNKYDGESITPSQKLIEAAASTVASKMLMHDGHEKTEQFCSSLKEAINEAEIDEKLIILAGLKELGLGYRKKDEEVTVMMNTPQLSNPDPKKFSSQVQGALSYSDNAIELIVQKGYEVLDSPGEEEEMSEWLDNMEVAVRP